MPKYTTRYTVHYLKGLAEREDKLSVTDKAKAELLVINCGEKNDCDMCRYRKRCRKLYDNRIRSGSPILDCNWIAPKDVKFTREQMEGFLLPNLYMLRQGEWPPEEAETGYSQIDTASIQRKHGNMAYFVPACSIAAEIGARLINCGRYKRIIDKLNCEPGGSPDKLAREFNMQIDDFNVLWGKLLIYISGWKRKRMPFKAWVNMGALGGK